MHLFRNLGGCRFEEVTRSAGLDGLAVAFDPRELDEDGEPTLPYDDEMAGIEIPEEVGRLHARFFLRTAAHRTPTARAFADRMDSHRRRDRR